MKPGYYDVEAVTFYERLHKTDFTMSSKQANLMGNYNLPVLVTSKSQPQALKQLQSNLNAKPRERDNFSCDPINLKKPRVEMLQKFLEKNDWVYAYSKADSEFLYSGKITVVQHLEIADAAKGTKFVAKYNVKFDDNEHRKGITAGEIYVDFSRHAAFYTLEVLKKKCGLLELPATDTTKKEAIQALVDDTLFEKTSSSDVTSTSSGKEVALGKRPLRDDVEYIGGVRHVRRKMSEHGIMEV